MRYMRCRCGRREAWTTMGHPPCEGCSSCGTTLAEHDAGHRTPIAHEWMTRWRIDEATGRRWQERLCVRCQRHEVIEGSGDDGKQ